VSSDPQILDRMNLAAAIAQKAGDFTLQYFQRDGLEVERKADRSPVTVADRGAEQLLRDCIAKHFRADGIIGEEHGTTPGTSGYEWVLDPIDGTKSFIHGVPLYTTLIAVLKDGEPVVGLIHAPALEETVYAARGAGCWFVRGTSSKPQSARVSKVARLSDSLLLTTEIHSFSDRPSGDETDAFLRLQSAAWVTRTWGDGYGYLLVATGRAEAMIDPIVNLWDAAALQNVIEEAGGHFTDWQGNPTIRAREAIATNGLVTEEVLAIIRK
jgi:histidinol phosphatase-like enzyme (inositol monophosphatase family)